MRQAIGAIFKAGVWVGVIGVIAVIALVAFVAMKVGRSVIRRGQPTAGAMFWFTWKTLRGSYSAFTRDRRA